MHDVVVFEKRPSPHGRGRLIIEVPASVRSKVKRNVKYLVILVPIAEINEQRIGWSSK